MRAWRARDHPMDLRAFVESIAMPSLALILHSEPGNFLLADGTVVNEMITRLLSWLRGERHRPRLTGTQSRRLLLWGDGIAVGRSSRGASDPKRFWRAAARRRGPTSARSVERGCLKFVPEPRD